MAGPTAAESLIKAAAAGEGAREGGGARRKGWKEMGGSTGPRPPNQSLYVRRTREPGWLWVRGNTSPGSTRVQARWMWGSCLLEKSKELGDPGRKRNLGPTSFSRALEASSLALPLGLHALTSWHPSLGFRTTPSLLTCRSPDPISRWRNEGSDSCLCGRSPHFINWRLEREGGGEEGGAKGG